MEISNIWYFLSGLTLLSALMVVLAKNPIHSVLYLVFTFFCISGHYVLLNAQFLMAVNIIVYAGAIMVLFLFIIMLLDTEDAQGAYPWKTAALGLATFFLLAAGVLWLFHWSGAVSAVKAGATPPELSANPVEFVTAAKAFGRLLYTKYLLPLELAGFLLLVALVGVVSLSKDNPETKA